MDYNIKDDNRSGKLWGGVAVTAYVGLLVLCFMVIGFSFRQPTVDEGIMIDFGTGESGWGEVDTPLADQAAESLPANSESGQEELLTQEHEEAPVVTTTTDRPQRRNDRPQTRPTTRPIQTPQPTERPRVADQNSLFPGRTVGSTSSSEGETTGAGNQGDPTGSPGGNREGGGVGNSGSAQLSGRNLIGSLPLPTYRGNDVGKVVVSITVDKQGNVVSASFNPVGSTTQNAQLREEAIKAARKAKFTLSDSNDMQSGTITYNFKLR